MIADPGEIGMRWAAHRISSARHRGSRSPPQSPWLNGKLSQYIIGLEVFVQVANGTCRLVRPRSLMLRMASHPGQTPVVGLLSAPKTAMSPTRPAVGLRKNFSLWTKRPLHRARSYTLPCKATSMATRIWSRIAGCKNGRPSCLRRWQIG